MGLLKDESKNPSEKEEQNNTSSDINNIDLNSIEIFSEDNQNIINRIITLGVMELLSKLLNYLLRISDQG